MFSFGPCQVMLTENKGSVAVSVDGVKVSLAALRFGDSVREQ